MIGARRWAETPGIHGFSPLRRGNVSMRFEKVSSFWKKCRAQAISFQRQRSTLCRFATR
jgi:hypothetical protein